MDNWWPVCLEQSLSFPDSIGFDSQHLIYLVGEYVLDFWFSRYLLEDSVHKENIFVQAETLIFSFFLEDRRGGLLKFIIPFQMIWMRIEKRLFRIELFLLLRYY